MNREDERDNHGPDVLKRLRNEGLLNEYAPDFSEISGTYTKNEAYCTSDQCAGLIEKVRKDVKFSADVCPDCGHYLFWKTRVLTR